MQDSVYREVARIDGQGKIGTVTVLVGRIDRCIPTAFEIRAGLGCEIAAGGESEHADLVRVNMPFRRIEADQSDRALRVLQ